VIKNDVVLCDRSGVKDLNRAYSFALDFDDELVSGILDRLGANHRSVILDPFCGTGTTLLESKRRGIQSFGIDANPVCVLIARAKLDWKVSRRQTSQSLKAVIRKFKRGYSYYLKQFETQKKSGRYYSPLEHRLFRHTTAGRFLVESGMMERGWISPRPALRALMLSEIIERHVEDYRVRRFLLLSLLGLIVPDISNMRYGPEIYVSKKRRDINLIELFAHKVEVNLDDLARLRLEQPRTADSRVVLGDSVNGTLQDMRARSIDFVVTSPPYPCEHDYTRMTRLELVLGGYVSSQADIRSVKQRLIRCCTRNIYSDDSLTRHVARFPGVNDLIARIERKSRDRSHGFARLYGRVVGEYFGGMKLHFEKVSRLLRSGGKCAYVVGDQASFFSVQIKTAEILARLAASAKCGLKATDLVQLRPLRGKKGKRRANYEWLLILSK
jgi:hypothetical protein